MAEMQKTTEAIRSRLQKIQLEVHHATLALGRLYLLEDLMTRALKNWSKTTDGQSIVLKLTPELLSLLDPKEEV